MRYLVIGTSGAGKSTFAKRLAHKIHASYIELDSRYWGFVPEDHVVGRPVLVWLSLNKDKGWFDGKIRFNRFFKNAER